MEDDFIMELNEIEREKGIPKSVIFDALKKALEKSYEKNFNDKANVIVEIDEESGKIDVFSLLDVVEDVHDPVTEILLDSARNMQAGVKVGDVIRKPVTPKDFGRISAQTARNIVIQKIKDAEREVVYNEFADREKEMITGTVQRYERNNVYINMGRTEGLLPLSEQVPGERVVANQRMKLFIQEVRNSPKGPQIVLSRANPGLVIRMFETEVPEISDGVVEIFSIAREAGSRTKIAVFSRDENVDPVGACVGFKGARVRAIVDELGGEKIDIIVWDKDIRTFIANALSPSKVTRVIVKEKEKTALVVVPDDQLSLAIGKEGQNARLAAKLTGRKIDIKGESFVTEEELAEDVPVSPTPSDFFDAIHELQTESTDETENEPWFDEVQAEDLQTDEDSVTAADDPIEENADNETQENPPA